jgi:hypothetical protein
MRRLKQKSVCITRIDFNLVQSFMVAFELGAPLSTIFLWHPHFEDTFIGQ